MAKSVSREEMRKKLKELGLEQAEKIEKNENPSIAIPVRGLSNVVFDATGKKLDLGEKIAKRYMFHTSHARKFMQTMIVAAFCEELISQGIHTTLRDVYYALKHTLPGTKENTIEEQVESDHAIVDLEVALDVIRENLHLAANPKGRVVGRVIVKDTGDTIDWSKLGTGGWAVPSIIEQVEFKEIDADYVLVAEKDAVFMRLHEDKAWDKNRYILVTTAGQAARGTRRLLQRLSEEQNLPIYCITDADPYGWYIYSTMKYGSMALAHVSDRLGCPKMHFLGLSISDIERYDLRNVTIKAKEVDIKRGQELLTYEWFKMKEWQTEIKKFLEKGYKAEIQALTSKHLRFISQNYIPEKIKGKDFLP
ncbi:DNA topoisomerase IV subunit A [Candidatus Micrarchaeota archaeon]|nr:DNA topoisomerase IV subunit A [Candidatus Micrarchaeota archaeon]